MISRLSTTTSALLVEEISSSLRDADFVILQWPRYFRAESWYVDLATSICDRLRVGTFPTAAGQGPVEVKSLASTCDNPKEVVLEVLSGSTSTSFPDVVEDLSRDRIPHFISLDFDNIRLDKWTQFFELLAKAYSEIMNPDISRCVVFFVHGADFRDHLRGGTGVRIIDYWNTHPPNDLRSLSQRLLPPGKWNPYEYLWRTSAYTAIANGDKDLLQLVCTDRPDNFSDLAEFIWSQHPDSINLKKKDRSKLEVSGLKINSIISETESGRVPKRLYREWQDGQIIGLTSIGEPQYSWYHLMTQLSDSDIRTHLSLLIWQEQLVSFFPLLIQLSSQVSNKITTTYGREWISLLDSSSSGASIVVEPSTILDVFSTYKSLPRLPRALWDFLHRLRKLRNKLAHTEPIEKREINELWDKVNSPSLGLYD